MDVVNPYFRSREAKEMLEMEGVRVIIPCGGLAYADLPIIPPAIFGALQNPKGQVVFDVGGDDLGAVALGQFKGYLPEGAYDLWFVVNTCRPFTGDPDGIIRILREIEAASRLKVTGLINNTNLGEETTPEIPWEGLPVVQETAKRLGVPVVFTSLDKRLFDPEKQYPIPVFPIERFMLPPW